MTRRQQHRAAPNPSGRPPALRAIVAALLLVLSGAACTPTSTDAEPSAAPDHDGGAAATSGESDPAGDGGAIDGPILVFAAASLTDAFADLARAFEARHPGTEVRLNLAGSSALREQILDGAPADVFAAADPSIMAEVETAGETTATPRTFARNRLRIAVPAGNPGALTGVDDFADPDLLLGLCAEGVPCGDLARTALAAAGVEPSLDTTEPDVRALLTKIGADELDAGIVYATDVARTDGVVEGIDLPPTAEAAAEAHYPIAPLASGPNPVAATAFVAFVLSEDGARILAEHGFEAP